MAGTVLSIDLVSLTLDTVKGKGTGEPGGRQDQGS